MDKCRDIFFFVTLQEKALFVSVFHIYFVNIVICIEFKYLKPMVDVTLNLIFRSCLQHDFVNGIPRISEYFLISK